MYVYICMYVCREREREPVIDIWVALDLYII